MEGITTIRYTYVPLTNIYTEYRPGVASRDVTREYLPSSDIRIRLLQVIERERRIVEDTGESQQRREEAYRRYEEYRNNARNFYYDNN
jgi:hypothetical protein